MHFHIRPSFSTMKDTSAKPLSACEYTEMTRRVALLAPVTALLKVNSCRSGPGVLFSVTCTNNLPFVYYVNSYCILV